MLPLMFATGCSDDDDNGSTPQVTSKTFQLASVADPNISGTAKFIKNDDNSTTVELQLTGTPAGGEHPAHIHFNTALESGGIARTLGTVSGDTGFSTITFSELDDATAITYEELLAYDGYINVHLSATELSTIVAQGDIGENELTGDTVAYDLNELDVAGISGTATFFKRANNEALAVLQLTGTPDGGIHPAHIHAGSVANPGDVVLSFTAVDGTTGKSVTNISALDDDTALTYDGILDFDGYINVHLSADDLTTIVAQGDIGANDQE
jgi:hypothetical protein